MEIVNHKQPTWFDTFNPIYAAYKRAYRDADELYFYMFERWRNDPVMYHEFRKPICDKKFGVRLERG